jgi:SAM-dependent methyltransferase
MERIIFDRMADLDSRHWWYRARREVLAKLIARKIRPPRDARILEIGCATGHNLGMLARFGEVEAVELDAAARAIATQRLGKPVAEHRPAAEARRGLADHGAGFPVDVERP